MSRNLVLALLLASSIGVALFVNNRGTHALEGDSLYQSEGDTSKSARIDLEGKNAVPTDSIQDRRPLPPSLREAQDMDGAEGLPARSVNPEEVAFDDLAEWTGPWEKHLERARRTILDSRKTFEEKGEAFTTLQIGQLGDDEDPRTEEILLEALLMIESTYEGEVLGNVLRGIDEIQDSMFVEPVSHLMINHPDAKVRWRAAKFLCNYEGNQQVQVALARVAENDENEKVRSAARCE